MRTVPGKAAARRSSQSPGGRSPRRVAIVAIAALCIAVAIVAVSAKSGSASGSAEGAAANAAAPKAARDLELFVTTDIHCLAKELSDGGPAFKRFISEGDGKDLAYVGALLDAFVAGIASRRPDLLVVTGDLTRNGERASHFAVAAKLKAVEELGVPVLVVPGNHDIANPWARGFMGDRQYVAQGVTPAEFLAIYRRFGWEEAVVRDAETMSYLAAPAQGLMVLMLDTNRYRENAPPGPPVANGNVPEATLRWIRNCAVRARAEGAVLVAAMHHSLLDHSPVIAEGYTLDNGDEVASLLAELGVRAAFTGHIHIQDASSRTFPAGTLYDIATNALSVYPHQYGVVRIPADRRSLDYRTEPIDVEGWARATGSTDPALLDYSRSSEAFFRERAAGMVRRVFDTNSVYSPAQAAAMAEAMGTLNARYFAGRENMNGLDLAKSEGYRLLAASDRGFMARYAASIVEDSDLDDNAVRIEW